ncbi:oxygen-responsive transcriptional regulator Btr [Cocleimonas flava]|uniref:CRP/FNR family transcriptional regulator n=1 Tax=Cocleimonas flava TaxID=634765 RepID=A0A4R1F5U5_9GAMM|nr:MULTISPECIES: Crp/Fnr family transcriptional regulator [Cocleimonas]MEB8431947.1 Crp/Fnr family transcriptional regulator [Cocleimonas sp. KMM 6892]MEC4714967.1 Crp/Fnr family transcriptional regulator [Cocleimonas sp. KMM 6895]MEC4744219.1 Crp/Fnr family transcriptional regulator [Cocleimonas sp. KMM 6896]TCJ87188.1 CRP/FNR family transcriptional regulator [Cocleimonas flava]
MSHVKCKGHCYTCPVRHQSIFSELPEESLEATIQDFHTSVLTFESGETLFRQFDDSSESAYTLRKGLIKVTKSLPDGRTQIVRILVAGDLFGFDGFANESYNNTAIALTDCEVCRLPMAELAVLRKSTPEIDQSMVARLIKNIRQSEDMLLELGAKKASEKLASFIMRLSLSDQNLSFSVDALDSAPASEWSKLHLSRSEIGSLLGLTIETVSRFFSDWKRKGFIKEEKGSIQILDATALKNAACTQGACN